MIVFKMCYVILAKVQTVLHVLKIFLLPQALINAPAIKYPPNPVKPTYIVFIYMEPSTSYTHKRKPKLYFAHIMSTIMPCC